MAKRQKNLQRSRRPKTSKRNVLSPAVIRYVKKSISSHIENKRLTTEFTKNLYHSGAGANFQSNNILPLCPNQNAGSIYTMVQGTSQQTRIGNSVRPKRVIFRGIMCPTPYNPTSNPTPNPVHLKMWIISTRRNVPGGSASEINTILQNTFFANGSGSLGMLGTLYDLITPANTDMVQVHYQRTFKLGYENYSGVTGGADSGQTKASNDYKLTAQFRINIAKYLTKVWRFNDNDSHTTSRQVYAVFQPVNFNGSIPVSTTTPVGLVAGIDVFFEDA